MDDQHAAARLGRRRPRGLQFAAGSGPGDRRGRDGVLRSRRRCARRSRARWTSPGRPRSVACSRRRRRSGRSRPRCRRRARPVGAGLRVWTATRQHDRWRFLRRYTAVRGSHSRVCPYELDSGHGCATRSGGGGRRGDPRRGARHRGGAGRSRSDGDLHGSQQRVRQRPVRLRPTRNHRGDRRTGHSTGRQRHPGAGRPPRYRRGTTPRGAHPATTTARSTSSSTTSGVRRSSRAARRRGTGRSGNTTSTTVCGSFGSASTPTSSRPTVCCRCW